MPRQHRTVLDGRFVEPVFLGQRVGQQPSGRLDLVELWRLARDEGAKVLDRFRLSSLFVQNGSEVIPRRRVNRCGNAEVGFGFGESASGGEFRSEHRV